jgi:hypothetical protein
MLNFVGANQIIIKFEVNKMRLMTRRQCQHRFTNRQLQSEFKLTFKFLWKNYQVEWKEVNRRI